MKRAVQSKLSIGLLAGVAAFAFVFAQIEPNLPGMSDGIAWAQGAGGGGGGGGGRGGGHGGGAGRSGSGSGESGMGGGSTGSGGVDRGGSGESGTTHGQRGSERGGQTGRGTPRGPSAESDGQGVPRNQPGSRRGTKPVWSQEGIPSVELGRLSVARSPTRVLDRQLKEALSTFDPNLAEPGGYTLAQLYSMSASSFASYMLVNLKTATKIDSPLANLALLKDILADGKTQLPGVTPASTVDLAAIVLGVASDKTIPITRDTVIAVTTILGVSSALTSAQIDELAAKAELVRTDIAIAHG